MEYQKKGEAISIVVLCNLEPVYIHRKWMRDREIITGQEYDDSNNRPVILTESVSTFELGHGIKVFCDKSRFQIESTDTTAERRIIDICRETLNLQNLEKITAIGINATIDFTFINAEDSLRFGNTFVPLEHWKTILSDPRVGSFSVQDNITNPTKDRPRRSINISSTGLDKRSQLPIVRISVNNHFVIQGIDDLGDVLSGAPEHYSRFNKWCNQIFDNLLA